MCVVAGIKASGHVTVPGASSLADTEASVLYSIKLSSEARVPLAAASWGLGLQVCADPTVGVALSRVHGRH